MRPRRRPSVRSPRRLVAAALTAACVAGLVATAPATSAQPTSAQPTSAQPTSAGSASDAKYVPGRVLVRFHQAAGRAARGSALARVGGVAIGRVYGEPTVVVRIPRSASVVDAAAELRSTPGVAWASPDGIARAAALPNDPMFGQQYALRNTGASGGVADADIDAPEGWTAAGLGAYPSTGGTSIGFVDSGIDTAHPEFDTRIKGCVHVETGGSIVSGCKDGFGHGTHVAGIAAATTNNSTGVAGVSFNSPIYVCRALNSSGEGPDSFVAACITWLHDQGVKVISMSLVSDTGAEMQAAVQNAWNGGAGSLLVAAAGNGGNTTPLYPAAFPEVISVGNTTSSDLIAPSSTHNADVELSAPGTNVLSTTKGQAYTMMTGTSMATPAVSGVGAVVWKLHPAFTAQQVRDKLDASVDDLGTVGRDQYFGFGRINLCYAADGSCAYTPGSSGLGAIAGAVKDTGGQPLKARVAVQTGPTAASTRSNAATGQYALSNLAPGSYTVRAKKRGCNPLTKPVTVTANATATLNFSLTCT